jgi:MFS family permease
VPIILLAFFYTRHPGLGIYPILLIVFYSFFIFLSSVKDPSSFSWIGDLVPEEERGKYFSVRNQVIGWIGVAIFLVGGVVLYFFEAKPYVLAIYALVFCISMVLRIISLYQVKPIFSPHFKLSKGYYFSFWSFLKRYDTFGKFAVFQAFFNFAVMVASPFFAVYMLSDLKFNLFTFTIVSLSSTIFYLLLTPFAGKFSDKYGNLKLLYIAAFAFPITPLLWLFFTNPLWLFLLPGLTAGIGNAALTIGTTNYTYDAVSPERRGLCVAYVGVLNGVGIFLGSILGGMLIQYLHVSFMNTTLFVFVLASVLRFGVAFIFLPQLKEVRKTERIRGFHWDITHPLKTIHSDIVWFKKFIWSH